MEPELIERLRGYRTELFAVVNSRGFAQRQDRDATLARLLATDRLLSAVVEPLPPVGIEDCATAQESR